MLKKAKTQFSFNKGRKSILGYVGALANEGGGDLILGVIEKKKPPHIISGTEAYKGCEGKLEKKIYQALRTRVKTEVLYDNSKRVLIIHVKPRPVGRWLTFEEIPLMRVGEELHPMNQQQMRDILLEQEGDFTESFCSELKITDLDKTALGILKDRYSEKQSNKTFLTESDEQILTDLDLYKDGKLKYASLILLGKKEKIKEYLPQCAIYLEYRSNPDNIQFDKRDIFIGPYFSIIDDVWNIRCSE